MSSDYAIIADLSKMQIVAAQIAEYCDKQLESGYIIYLQGELGAGKTTFVRGFMRALGYNERVKSPTFGLMEIYELANLSVVHLDLYRLERAEELISLGIEDFINSNTICLIEWPERGKGYLPNPDLRCELSITNQDCRELKFYGESVNGVNIIEYLKAPNKSK